MMPHGHVVEGHRDRRLGLVHGRPAPRPRPGTAGTGRRPLARVSIRSTASPATILVDLRPPRRSPPCPRGRRLPRHAGVHRQHDVDDELLALGALVVEHPVVPPARRPQVSGPGAPTSLPTSQSLGPLRPRRARRARGPARAPRPGHHDRVPGAAHVVDADTPTPRLQPRAPRPRRWRRRVVHRPGPACRRPAGRPGSACGRPRRVPDGPAPQDGQSCSSAQLCAAVLAKPRPGSTTTRSQVHPGVRGRHEPRGELVADLVTTSS